MLASFQRGHAKIILPETLICACVCDEGEGYTGRVILARKLKQMYMYLYFFNGNGKQSPVVIVGLFVITL